MATTTNTATSTLAIHASSEILSRLNEYHVLSLAQEEEFEALRKENDELRQKDPEAATHELAQLTREMFVALSHRQH